MNVIVLLVITYLSGDSIDIAVAMTATTSSARACTRTTSDSLEGLPSGLIFANFRLQLSYNQKAHYQPIWGNWHSASALFNVP